MPVLLSRGELPPGRWLPLLAVVVHEAREPVYAEGGRTVRRWRAWFRRSAKARRLYGARKRGGRWWVNRRRYVVRRRTLRRWYTLDRTLQRAYGSVAASLAVDSELLRLFKRGGPHGGRFTERRLLFEVS